MCACTVRCTVCFEDTYIPLYMDMQSQLQENIYTSFSQSYIHELYYNLLPFLVMDKLHAECEIHCQSTVPSCLGLGGRSVRQIVSAQMIVAMNTITDVPYKRDADNSLCSCSTYTMWECTVVCDPGSIIYAHIVGPHATTITTYQNIQSPLRQCHLVHTHYRHVYITLSLHKSQPCLYVSPCSHIPTHIGYPGCNGCEDLETISCLLLLEAHRKDNRKAALFLSVRGETPTCSGPHLLEVEIH